MSLALAKNHLLVNLICKMQFVPLSYVSNYNSEDGHERQVSASFFDLYGSPSSIVFTQSEEKTPSGSIYSQQITCNYPGLEKMNAKSLYAIDQLEHLVKFIDNYGQAFIMGSPDAGASLRWEYSSAIGGHTIIFSLDDTFPIGYDKEIGRFFFDERGYLMTTYESTETFYFDAQGNLMVNGPEESDYYLSNGILYRN